MITRGGARNRIADDGFSYDGRHERRDDPPPVVVGTDFGFSRNSSACAAASPRGRMIVLLGWREWRPGLRPLRPSSVFAGVADFAADHGAERVWADGHYREAAREVFDARAIVLLSAPAVPAVAYLEVQRLLQEDRIRGLDCEGEIIGPRPEPPVGLLRSQLESVRAIREQGGHTRIEIPTTRDGRHGDIAAAAVLAIWAASTIPAGGAYVAPIGGSLVRA